MSLSIVTRGFKEIQRSLKKLEAEKAIAAQQALNRTANTVRSAAVKKIAEEMGGARQKDIRAATDIRKASRVTPSAQVIVREKGMGLEKLRKLTKVRKQRGKRAYDVTYKGQRIPGAFKIPELGGEGSKVLFVRKNGKLKRLYGFTSYQETERGGKRSPVVLQMEKTAAERFTTEYDRALANRLRRAGF